MAGVLGDVDQLLCLLSALSAVGAQEEQYHGVDGEAEAEVTSGEDVFAAVAVDLVEEGRLHELEQCLGELFLGWLQAHEHWL